MENCLLRILKIKKKRAVVYLSCRGFRILSHARHRKQVAKQYSIDMPLTLEEILQKCTVPDYEPMFKI